jgi:hypothetical protein
LKKLSDFLQAGIDLFPSFRPINNTDPTGEESNEPSEGFISGIFFFFSYLVIRMFFLNE